jgi:hypothetical protein
MNPSNVFVPVLMKPKASLFPVAVVSVGAVPPLHLIVGNQFVTTLDPVASCVKEIMNFRPFVAPVTETEAGPVVNQILCS